MIFFIKIFEYTLGTIVRSLFLNNSSKKRYYKHHSQNRNNSVIRFSFGKYKGEPVEKIWKSNKGYIDWLRENIDLTKYPNEEFAIENLVNSEV